MIRRRSKIVVTDSWFLAAADNVAEKSCAICANCDSKNTKPAAFVEKHTNAERRSLPVAQLAQLPNKQDNVENSCGASGANPDLRRLRQIASSSLPVKGGVKEGVIREAGAAGATQKPSGVCPHCLGPQPDAADIAPAGAGHCRECWVTWGRAIPLHGV